MSLWAGGSVRGEGVLVYKNQTFHPDQSAPAIRYDRIEGEGFVSWVFVGKEKKRFEKTQFHLWLELPQDLPHDVTSDYDLKAISLRKDEMEKFTKRFPNAAPIAKKSLDLHIEWCAKIKEGMVRHGGEWMPKKTYLDLQAKIAADEQAAKDLAERKSKELVESEMQRKLAKEREVRRIKEAARAATVDRHKAKLRKLQDEIAEIEESTDRLVGELKTLVEKEKQP
ncbi:hypothetical protein OKA04_10735 [Luteolibacter flavescens]|uniref:Uncharacterized protein n=1 Tax=Luteolibacter flavescens TaxID=1859460 RepID=A0ABT3FNQ6_9BACT|nr:hypothetical protein [Luteolibacter flavescens]MCW1885204.1 hypothetical protein [Luteolibacter flavescens]